jgi:hypothetical protein
MKTLLVSYAVWLTGVVAMIAALHGVTRWIVGTLLVVTSAGSFVSDLGRCLAGNGAPGRGPQTLPGPSPRDSLDQTCEQPPDLPGWGLSLLVDADEAAGVLHPSVQFIGPRPLAQATVSLDVIDGSGDVRLTTERAFQHPDLGTDLDMGTLALPDGASVDEAVRWEWQVTLRHGDEEVARQRGPLAGAGHLNDEAELEVLGLLGRDGQTPAIDRETLLELLARRSEADGAGPNEHPVHPAAAARARDRLEAEHSARRIAAP